MTAIVWVLYRLDSPVDRRSNSGFHAQTISRRRPSVIPHPRWARRDTGRSLTGTDNDSGRDAAERKHESRHAGQHRREQEQRRPDRQGFAVDHSDDNDEAGDDRDEADNDMQKREGLKRRAKDHDFALSRYRRA